MASHWHQGRKPGKLTRSTIQGHFLGVRNLWDPVIHAVMTVDVPSSEEGLPLPSGVWALSQSGFQEVFPEVRLYNGHLWMSHLPLPLCSSTQPGTWHALREAVLSGFAKQESGLVSGLLGTIHSLTSLVCSDWPISLNLLGIRSESSLGLTSIPSWGWDATPCAPKMRLGSWTG